MEQEACRSCSSAEREQATRSFPSEGPRLSIVLSGRYRSRMIMLGVFHVFQTIGYYGFGTLVPLVLASKGYSIVTSLTFTTLTFIGYPIGSALSLPDHRAGRSEMADCGFRFPHERAGDRDGLLIIASRDRRARFSVHGGQQRVLEWPAHLSGRDLSDLIRATAAGACYGLSRLSSAAMPFVLLPVLERWGAGPMFVVVATALWIVMLDVAIFAPPTSGRSLEEVNG